MWGKEGAEGDEGEGDGEGRAEEGQGKVSRQER